MSIFNLKKSIQHLGRYREIISILLKYGFEDVIDQLNVDIALKKIRSKSLKRAQEPHQNKSRPERVRLALEELGPTFIKLGQMLSTRYDLLPVAYVSELRKLQDKVPPFPADESIRIIEEELGQSVRTIFKSYDKEPVAAASIAQVHRACTQSGEEVVVKVMRPDIIEIIQRDIPILKDLAGLIERYIPESHVFDPSGLVSQFKKWISEELNFIQEGRNIHRFKTNFTDDETVYVPAVFWKCTTERVLTLEYIEGIYIDQVESLKKSGLDPVQIAKNGTLFVLRQIFEYHFFHGDPHPSNLLVLPDQRIAPLDYGLMGRLDDELVSEIGELLRGIIRNDALMIVHTLINLNRLKTDVDRETLRIDVSDLLARYHAVPLHMLKFGNFFNDLVKVIRDNRIQFPRSLYLMGKAQMVMESIAQKLDPKFDIISTAKSYFTSTMIGRAEAEKFFRNMTLMWEDYTDLLVVAPRMLTQILKKARWGQMGINLHHMRIDDILNEMDRFANRLSFSMIIASLVVGSSLVVQIDKGPKLWDLPIFGLIGFLLAGIMGLWLVFNILRSGHL
ncbi:AarF/ABC1/UbiB kinase family protein [bacterium]|nr:AarF/ABC1/UbiB kinase family protein [bacterium]